MAPRPRRPMTRRVARAGESLAVLIRSRTVASGTGEEMRRRTWLFPKANGPMRKTTLLAAAAAVLACGFRAPMPPICRPSRRHRYRPPSSRLGRPGWCGCAPSASCRTGDPPLGRGRAARRRGGVDHRFGHPRARHFVLLHQEHRGRADPRRDAARHPGRRHPDGHTHRQHVDPAPTLILQYHFDGLTRSSRISARAVNYSIFFGEQERAASPASACRTASRRPCRRASTTCSTSIGRERRREEALPRHEGEAQRRRDPRPRRHRPWIVGAGVTYRF